MKVCKLCGAEIAQPEGDNECWECEDAERRCIDAGVHASIAFDEGRRSSGRCSDCEAVMINGVFCHEAGCISMEGRSSHGILQDEL